MNRPYILLHPPAIACLELTMDFGMFVGTFFLVAIVLFVVALSIRPLRKTIGLLLVILGFLACLTGFGMLLGIPMIFVGGILLFI